LDIGQYKNSPNFHQRDTFLPILVLLSFFLPSNRCNYCRWCMVKNNEIFRYGLYLYQALGDFYTFCGCRKIPGTIWYAVGRVFLYDRLEQAKSNVVLGLLIEAIVNSLAGLFALIISIMISPVPLISGLPTWTLTILVIIFLGFSIISPKLITIFISRAKWFSKQIDSENKPKIGYSTMSFWLFGQTLVVLLGAGVAYFLIKSIDQSPTISFALILGSWGFSVALGLIATWFPADIGLKNGIMYVALSPLVGGPLAGVFTLSGDLGSFLEILLVHNCIRLRGLLEQRRDNGRSHSHIEIRYAAFVKAMMKFFRVTESPDGSFL